MMDSNQKFDRRLMEKHQINGLLAEKDVKSFLQSLPDEAEHAEYIPVWDAQLTLPSQKLRHEREMARHDDGANGAAREEEEN